jgi:hypothetical protein
MFELKAECGSFSCPSRPWLENWRRAVPISYGDFEVEFFAASKTDMTWEAFIDSIRAKSHWHSRAVCRYSECLDALPKTPRPSFPVDVLWEACPFGDLEWNEGGREDDNHRHWYMKVKPSTTCADVEAMVPACCLRDRRVKGEASTSTKVLEDKTRLAKLIAKHSGDGRLGSACVPGAFDEITQWKYVYDDRATSFEVSFGTHEMWYWVSSFSS